MLATAAAAATILVGSALLMWGTIQRASRAAAQGQGEALLQACRLGLRGRGRPDAARMERVLKQKRDQGLRYIGVWTPGGRVVAEAGEALGSGVKTDGAIHFGDRVRLTRRQPPRGEGGRGGRGRGRPGMGRGRPGMGRGRPGMGMGPGGHPPPFLVIEFVPLTARSLQTQAKTLLAVVGGAVLAMVLLVVVAGRAMSGREALMAQLEQRRRLAELGEMSAVLAHELRNPLTSLKGHAQLLEEVLPEGKQQDKAGKVVGEAVRLERLLADLLTFVRTGEVQGRPVDPGELLRRAADEVDSARVALEVAPGLGRWQLDPERMNQALVNLLQNALQAEGALTGRRAIARCSH